MPIFESSSAYARSLMGVHLFHFHISNCSQRARFALELKEVSWTSHHLDLSKGEHLSPDYLAINPNGVVPALVHDGVTVLESNDIITYLNETFLGVDLDPESCDQPIAASLLVLASDVQRALKTLSHHYLFRPFRNITSADVEAMRAAGAADDITVFMADYAENGPAWAERVRASEAEMQDAIRKLEARLSEYEWLGGRQFGLADISWSVNAYRLHQCNWPMREDSLVLAWLERISAMAAFRRMVVDYVPC